MSSKISTIWAMPNKYTFQIPPIEEFVKRWVRDCKIIVDPFCGASEIATHRNDIRLSYLDSAIWCDSLSIVADAVIFDPPYSPRQIKESYSSVGLKCTIRDTQNGALYKKVKGSLANLLKPGGIALSFGWQSSGFGKAWATEEIMLVQHGGAHNDTICVAQRKPIKESTT